MAHPVYSLITFLFSKKLSTKFYKKNGDLISLNNSHYVINLNHILFKYIQISLLTLKTIENINRALVLVLERRRKKKNYIINDVS